MTLILGMAKADGVYLSADYRVTDVQSGRLMDDTVVKHLTIQWPPAERGTRALLAWTGAAALPDGTPTGQWIRQTLRGETSDTFDQSMALLGTRLRRDAGSLRVGLIINLLALHGERRYLGAFSNIRLDETGNTTRVDGAFGYLLQELDGPFSFANGSGARRVQTDGHAALMRRQLAVWPRAPSEHMKLLATINRRVAAKVRSVSPHCHVSFMPPLPGSARSHTFTEGSEAVPFEMPFLLCGIDLTDMTRHAAEQFTAFCEGRPGAEPDLDTMNRNLKRRP